MRIVPFLLAAATLAAQPAPQVRLPQYTHEVLANGAVLDLMPRKGVPLVSVLVLVKGGAESDPAELAGLSSLTAELLRRERGGCQEERNDSHFAASGFSGISVATVLLFGPK